MSDTKKRPSRLGRGLSSLIGNPVAINPPPPPPPAETSATDATTTTPASRETQAPWGPLSPHDPQPAAPAEPSPQPAATELTDSLQPGIRYVPLDAIVPNRHQPRQHFDEAALRSLAESIRRDGLMQPVVLRDVAPDRREGVGGAFELVAGERRWRAARLAGLDRIPAMVRDLDDQQLAELALIENLQREDLNPIDRAEAFQRLAERFGMSHDEIASRVGLDRSTVANLVRLLSLAAGVQQLVRDDLLSMGHARALVAIGDLVQQDVLAKRAVRDGMSVREVEAAVRKLAAGGSQPGPTADRPPRSRHFEDLERQIGEQLGTRVTLAAGRKKGAGKLTIEFYSLDQFDSLLTRLGVSTD
jgi:ParB family chromosome partitioning protein